MISDRLDRRWLVFFCQAGVTAFIFLLATLVVTDKVALWHIYLISFVLGTIQALNLPARMALVPDLVSRDLIMNAVALNSAMLNSGRIIGTGVGWRCGGGGGHQRGALPERWVVRGQRLLPFAHSVPSSTQND